MNIILNKVKEIIIKNELFNLSFNEMIEEVKKRFKKDKLYKTIDKLYIADSLNFFIKLGINEFFEENKELFICNNKFEQEINEYFKPY